MKALRQYLEAHGMSGADFAEWIGVSRQTVAAWLRGAKVPSPKHITLVAQKTRGEVGPETWFPAAPSNGNGNGKPAGRRQ